MAELSFNSVGEGEPLVILHGLFGSSKNWQSHARFFAGQFQVITVDLRNHGRSFHADEMTYDLMMGDVLQLLDHLNLSDCRLLGHSMGGKVSMALALKHPERVRRLIVADIAPVAYFHHYDDLLDPILALSLDRVENRGQADQLLRPNIPEDQLRAFLLQNLVREQEQWRWRVNWAVIKRDMENLTGFELSPDDWRIDIPTLFIRGANSDYVGESEIEVIESHFSDARIETIADAGHWLHAERPEAFSRVALNFLAG